jgi:hypothetical protein
VSVGLLALLLGLAPAQGALEQLAAHVAAQASAAGAEAPLAVSVSALGHPSLEDAFATLLLSALSARGLEPQLLPLGEDAEALARARGSRALLRLRLTLDGTLAASGDVLSTWVNFFSGRRPPRKPTPSAVVFFEVAEDAAVRALAARPEGQALRLEPEALARFSVRTAALAAGDLDGDGRAELAVLTEEAVEVRAADGRLLARRVLSGLPLAEPVPREPFGTLCVCEGLLYAYSATRAQGEVLALVQGELVVRAPLLRPVVACGRPPLEAAFLPGVSRLVPVGKGWPELASGPSAWGLFARSLPGGQGWLLLYEDGTARTLGPAGSWRTLLRVGAGAALVEGKGGSAFSVAASSDAATPAVDRLRLLGAADGVEHGSVEVPGRILQVTSAALETNGAEALVLGVWRPEGGAELRLVRGAR